MNRIDEIRARCERAQREDYPEQIYGCAAYYCVYDDIPYLLVENERLQGELQDREYQISLDAMEQSRDEAIERAEKAEARTKNFMYRRQYAVELAGLCKEAGSDRLHELAEADKDGRCVMLPKIPYNKTLYWIWGNEIMPVLYKGIRGGTVTKDGKYHVSCDMTTKKPRTFVHTYRRKPYKTTIRAGDKRIFYADDIGKTIFLTREAAKATLEANYAE